MRDNVKYYIVMKIIPYNIVSEMRAEFWMCLLIQIN